jgi:DNA repair ATPase RecN
MSEDEFKKYHHFKIKTSDGIELDLIETKYYEELLDLYKQEKAKAEEYRIGWCNTGEELEQEKEKNKELEEKQDRLAFKTNQYMNDVLSNNIVSKDKIRELLKVIQKEKDIATKNILEKDYNLAENGAICQELGYIEGELKKILED